MSIYTVRTTRTFPDHPTWKVTTKYLPEDRESSIHGTMCAGWRWYFETVAPSGEQIVGIVRGPYETEEECLADAGFQQEEIEG